MPLCLVRHNQTLAMTGGITSEPSSVARERSLYDPGQVADVLDDCLLTPTLDGVFSRVSASHSGSVQAKQPYRFHEQSKRKLGRPMIYTLDKAANLTETDKRRFRRAIANRRSAQRVRERKQETIKALRAQVDLASHHNASMTRHLSEIEACNAGLIHQLHVYEAKWDKALACNRQLIQMSTMSSTRSLDTAPSGGQEMAAPQGSLAIRPTALWPKGAAAVEASCKTLHNPSVEAAHLLLDTESSAACSTGDGCSCFSTGIQSVLLEDLPSMTPLVS